LAKSSSGSSPLWLPLKIDPKKEKKIIKKKALCGSSIPDLIIHSEEEV
jgi:hypothetical protein